MNAQSENIKYSEVLNRLVLDRRTAEEVGRVEQLWIEPQAHQIVGFTCKSGFLGSKKRSFAWEQIEAIGNDSILLNLNPNEVELDKPDPAFFLIGHEVWTDAGNKAGKIVDYLFVPQTGAIVGYLFVSNGWRGVLDGIYILPTSAIASVGSRRAIVPDAIVQNPLQYAEGFNQKVTQAAEFLIEDYMKTQGDWDAIRRNAQTITEKVKEKTEKVKTIAQEKLSEVRGKEEETSRLDDKLTTIETEAEPMQGTSELPESNH